MYDKWQLNRNPFYTRPIEQLTIADFAAREKELETLNSFSKDDGVIVLIGDPGVGSTSIANYSRFSNKAAVTPRYEFKMEHISTGLDMLKTLIYGLATEITKCKLRSKHAKAVLKNFSINPLDLSIGINALGLGVNMKGGKGLPENPMALMDVFNSLVLDIIEGSKKKLLIFQLNNMNIHSPEAQDRIHTVLDQMRDVFQTPQTLWYLLGDSALERTIKDKIPRLSSIVKTWLLLSPINAEGFGAIYEKRIKNSGKNAIAPFTKEGVSQLCLAAHGRIRYAFDIASALIQKYADTIYPETIDVPLIKKEADEKIAAIVGKDNFSPKAKEILYYIVSHPGIGSGELSKGVSISTGNLTKFVNPLIEANLVEKIVNGRVVNHYPIGLAHLLK
ncbi:MAG: hypothetical protein KJ737_06830 [Proteobacteria bacterium]|nr:hypothetical protein [Pseudomonadota bacterium]